MNEIIRSDNLKYDRWLVEAKESAALRRQRKKARKSNREPRAKLGRSFKRPPVDRQRPGLDPSHYRTRYFGGERWSRRDEQIQVLLT